MGTDILAPTPFTSLTPKKSSPGSTGLINPSSSSFQAIGFTNATVRVDGPGAILAALKGFLWLAVAFVIPLAAMIGLALLLNWTNYVPMFLQQEITAGWHLAAFTVGALAIALAFGAFISACILWSLCGILSSLEPS